MKAFAQFLTKSLTQEIVPALGSDGFLPLDARLRAENLTWLAVGHGKRLNANLNKGFVAVEIHRGNLKQSHIVAIQYF